MKSSRLTSRGIAVGLWVAAWFGVCCASHSSINGTAASDDNLLPLSDGKTWELRSAEESLASQPIRLEVIGREGDGYRVRFDNPWSEAEWVLDRQGDTVLMRSASLNGNAFDLPPDTVYFDLAAAEQQEWSNAIGTIRLTSRDKTVETPLGTFQNCVEFLQIGRDGTRMSWTLAPGVGFVAFGEGDGAFRLARLEGNATPAPGPARPAPPRPRKPVNATPTSSVTLGLSPSPSAHLLARAMRDKSPKDFQAIKEDLDHRVCEAAKAGLRGAYVSQRWDEIEKNKQAYDFGDVDSSFSRALDCGQTIELFTLRVPDSNNRSMPKDLEAKAFDDPVVQKRLLRLIDELVPRLKEAGVRRVSIGNEIDLYFKQHFDEVDDFRRLFASARARIQEFYPGVRVSSTVTLDGLVDGKTRRLLAPLLRSAQYFSVTFYPLRPDFTMRDPERAAADLVEMLDIADDLDQTEIVVQELGYPSSSLNKSSPEAQARFFELALERVLQSPTRFSFVNLFLTCDMPEWMVENFAEYYKLPNADRFKAYLRTLGLFDAKGEAKPAWAEVQAKVRPAAR